MTTLMEDLQRDHGLSKRQARELVNRMAAQQLRRNPLYIGLLLSMLAISLAAWWFNWRPAMFLLPVWVAFQVSLLQRAERQATPAIRAEALRMQHESTRLNEDFARLQQAVQNHRNCAARQ